MRKTLFLSLVAAAVILISGCGKTPEQKTEPVATPEQTVQQPSETVTETPTDTALTEPTQTPTAAVGEAKIAKKIACNNPAPAFTLTDLKGNNISLADYAGKVVILDFWAVWCGPCRMEIPGFIELQNKYSSDGLVVIGVSLDRERSKVPGFVDKQGINYPIIYADQSIITAYGNPTSIPTTFIIDRNGCIKQKLVGYHPKDQFEKIVKPLLDSKLTDSGNGSSGDKL